MPVEPDMEPVREYLVTSRTAIRIRRADQDQAAFL